MFSVSISNQAIYIGADTVPLRGMDNVMTTSDASRECCCSSSCSRRWRFVCNGNDRVVNHSPIKNQTSPCL